MTRKRLGDRAPDNPFNHRRLLSARHIYRLVADIAGIPLLFSGGAPFQRARNIGFESMRNRPLTTTVSLFIQAGADAGLLL